MESLAERKYALNLQRASILCRHHLNHGTVLLPREVATEERLLWLGGWYGGLRFISLGNVLGNDILSPAYTMNLHAN